MISIYLAHSTNEVGMWEKEPTKYYIRHVYVVWDGQGTIFQHSQAKSGISFLKLTGNPVNSLHKYKLPAICFLSLCSCVVFTSLMQVGLMFYQPL